MRIIGWWVWTFAWTMVAGAAVNVLLTWGIAMWMPMKVTPMPYAGYAGPGYPPQWPGPDGRMGWWERAEGWGIESHWLCGTHGAEGEFAYFSGHYELVEDVGWPMRGMRSHVAVAYDANRNALRRWDLPAQVILDRGLQTDDLPKWMCAQVDRRIPLRPRGWGFVANTLLFAIVIGGLYAAMRTLNGRPE